MREIDRLLSIYGESHKNKTNKLIHWVCVPAIMFSLTGLIMHIPFFTDVTFIKNWAAVALILALFYYFKLSVVMFLGFLSVGSFILYFNLQLMRYCAIENCNSAMTLLVIFIVAWIGQFIGHKIEGRKPSFLQDLQFLLIGPAWLLHFIFNKLGIRY